MDPLWASLINSDWHDHLGSGRREDRLGNDRWLADFLRRTVWRGRGLTSRAERAKLRDLRSLLRRMVDALIAGEPIPESHRAVLNDRLANAPVVRRLESDGAAWRVDFAAPRGDIDDVVGEIAGAFAAMLAAGNGDRVKVCENPDCRWVMLDGSRNRSRRWCEAAECGNVMKVRRYRDRRRSALAARRDPSLRSG